MFDTLIVNGFNICTSEIEESVEKGATYNNEEGSWESVIVESKYCIKIQTEEKNLQLREN